MDTLNEAPRSYNSVVKPFILNLDNCGFIKIRDLIFGEKYTAILQTEVMDSVILKNKELTETYFLFTRLLNYCIALSNKNIYLLAGYTYELPYILSYPIEEIEQYKEKHGKFLSYFNERSHIEKGIWKGDKEIKNIHRIRVMKNTFPKQPQHLLICIGIIKWID
jgi:hypothetical protein